MNLKANRRARGWTQQRAAAELGMSQTYLSLLEAGRRPLTRSVVRELRRVYQLPPTFEPLPPVAEPLASESDDALAMQLGGLGYSGFGYLKPLTAVRNPALLLVQLLVADQRDPRVVEAAPWLVANFDLDWEWLNRVARLHDIQNRLGFVVALAAERYDKEHLRAVENELAVCKLQKEGTLCDERMSVRLRHWVKANRTSHAARWNMLSDLRSEILP